MVFLYYLFCHHKNHAQKIIIQMFMTYDFSAYATRLTFCNQIRSFYLFQSWSVLCRLHLLVRLEKNYNLKKE